MTKTLAINPAATWAATVTTIQNGDPATEATMDAVMTSVANRLGAIYTLADTAIHTTDNESMQSGSSITFASGSTLTAAAGSTVVLRGSVTVTGGADLTVAAKLTRSSSAGTEQGKITQRALVVGDANATASTDYDYVEIDVAGATQRTVTLRVTSAPIPTRGDTVIVRKIGNGAGGGEIVNEGSATYICRWNGAQKGQAQLVFDGSYWRLLSGTNTSAIGADAY